MQARCYLASPRKFAPSRARAWTCTHHRRTHAHTATMPFGMEFGLPSFGWLREHFTGGEGKSIDQLPFDRIISGGILVTGASCGSARARRAGVRACGRACVRRVGGRASVRESGFAGPLSLAAGGPRTSRRRLCWHATMRALHKHHTPKPKSVLPRLPVSPPAGCWPRPSLAAQGLKDACGGAAERTVC